MPMHLLTEAALSFSPSYRSLIINSPLQNPHSKSLPYARCITQTNPLNHCREAPSKITMANTTMADQPNAQGFEYYRYDPSMAAAIIFTILFFFTTMIHFYQFVRTRTWIMIPLLVGGFCILPPSLTIPQLPTRIKG